MGSILRVALGIFTAIVAFALAVAAYIGGEALYYQWLLAPASERDLGFKHGTACLRDSGGRGYVAAVAIESVADGGLFQQVGSRGGDVLPDVSYSSLSYPGSRLRTTPSVSSREQSGSLSLASYSTAT
jgi:hypothetical protein